MGWGSLVRRTRIDDYYADLTGEKPRYRTVADVEAEPAPQTAEEQARGIGAEGRFVICAGSPTTQATPPKRLRDWGRFMQEQLPVKA